MRARILALLAAAAAGIAALALDTLRDDRDEAEPRAPDEDRRAVVRFGARLTDAFMRLRLGHGIDEAARLDLENGAERVAGHLTLSGRDPPP